VDRPSPEVLELSGNKVAGRRSFEESGFPVLPGAGPFTDVEDAVRAAGSVGFPIMVTAVFGGGGIGMGIAGDEDSLRKAVDTASTRGARFFADPSTSSDTSRTPGTSRSRFSPTTTARSLSTSGSARSSAGTSVASRK
jgi:Carbamoyl-phosphate synthase L chain, ATP binding domain